MELLLPTDRHPLIMSQTCYPLCHAVPYHLKAEVDCYMYYQNENSMLGKKRRKSALPFDFYSFIHNTLFEYKMIPHYRFTKIYRHKTTAQIYTKSSKHNIEAPEQWDNNLWKKKREDNSHTIWYSNSTVSKRCWCFSHDW